MFAGRSQNLGKAYFCAAEMRILLTNYNILAVVACNPEKTFEYLLWHIRIHLGIFFLHPVRVEQWTLQKIHQWQI
jgi:hypothetical protein